MSTTILTMVGVAVTTAVGEKVSNAFGKQELGQFIAIGGLSLVGVTALKLVYDMVTECRKLF